MFDKLNIGSLMKNFGKIQEMMEQTQTDLENMDVTGESGAGAVTVHMNAKHYVKQISISDDIMTESKDIIEELIAAALNDAAAKVEKITQDKMMDAGRMFGGNKKEADE